MRICETDRNFNVPTPLIAISGVGIRADLSAVLLAVPADIDRMAGRCTSLFRCKLASESLAALETTKSSKGDRCGILFFLRVFAGKARHVCVHMIPNCPMIST